MPSLFLSKFRFKSTLLNRHMVFTVLSIIVTSPLMADSKSLLYPQLKSPVAQTIGGNWRVTLSDKSKVRESVYVVMVPPSETYCEKINERDCNYYRADNPKGKWDAYYTGSGNIYERSYNIKGSNSMDFKHSYGLIGHWGANSSIKFGGDKGSGRWVYGDESGSEQWQRLRPTIEKIGFGRTLMGSEMHKKKDDPDTVVVNYGTKGHVTGTYKKWYWNPDVMPGNRPIFYISLYGENLWGHHITDFKNSPGFKSYGCRGIYKKNSGKFMDHIGVKCNIGVMTGITNGNKKFRFDNLEIPFVFDIKGLVNTSDESDTIDVLLFPAN